MCPFIQTWLWTDIKSLVVPPRIQSPTLVLQLPVKSIVIRTNTPPSALLAWQAQLLTGRWHIKHNDSCGYKFQFQLTCETEVCDSIFMSSSMRGIQWHMDPSRIGVCSKCVWAYHQCRALSTPFRVLMTTWWQRLAIDCQKPANITIAHTPCSHVLLYRR